MPTPTLPAPPRALAAILEAASDPGVDVQVLARLVANDPTFAGVVLKMVNTAAYLGSRSQSITDLRAAALRLGVRTLRNLALCHAARSCVSTQRIGSLDLDDFWENSMRRAVAGRMLAEWDGHVEPSGAFTIGLLQELGALALLLENPEQSEAWTKASQADSAVRLRLENSLFGCDYTTVNGQLAADWSLPDEIALPLQFHNTPAKAPEPLRRACEIACAANFFCAILSNTDTRQALQRARTEIPRLVPNAPEDLDPLVAELGAQVEQAGQAMGIKVGHQPTLEEILSAANRSLIDMNLSYEDIVQRLEQVIAEKDELAAELDRRNRELEWISITDALTELPNRRELFRRLNDELQRVARHGGRTSLIVADIDHFKRVNDTWGHVFGDVVLKAVAKALKESCRTSDTVARTGGEEFAMLLPETDLTGASYVARRILGGVSKLELETPNGHTIRVTVSLGIAWLEGPRTSPFDREALITRLYNAADQALYRSKTGGRNRATRCPNPLEWAPSSPEADAVLS
ncbi:MAG: diguanylate cyclase [Myxococcota bacterium]